MYIKITTRCNMRCPHCCYSAEDTGSDMSLGLFMRILDRWGPTINEGKRYIVLGGGEPTLHPEFWRFVGYAMSRGEVWLATNGSHTQDSLALCRMAKKGLLRAALSLDEYHDPIDPEVAKAFTSGLDRFDCGLRNPKDPKDHREVRFATKPTKGGRCLVGEEGCPCRGVQIDPEGTVLACGCDDAPVIGTVAEGITDRRFLDYPLFTGCHMDTRPAAKQGRARARAS